MDTLNGVMATAAGVGFWVNFCIGVREYKPHLFKHNCRKCFKSGLMRCPKCDGNGLMKRARRDSREAMTIQRRMTEMVDDGGLFDCKYCEGKGVKPCGTCQGQGWEYLPFVNYRKFQPHPVFEQYHWSRDKLKQKPYEVEKKIEKAVLNKSLEQIEDSKSRNTREERKAAKEVEKKRKEAEKAAKRKAARAKKKDLQTA